MQGYLGRSVDLLDPDVMAAALTELRQLIPARTLVVHTKFWAAVLGPDPDRWQATLLGGITMASTRFCHGDEFTAADYVRVGAGPVNPLGAGFAQEIERRLVGAVRCGRRCDSRSPDRPRSDSATRSWAE